MFLGCPLSTKRWLLWGASIRHGAQLVPEDEVMRVVFDDTTKKKAGRQLPDTPALKDRSRWRAGIEATMSRLTHHMGLARLRMRRMVAVCYTVFLRALGLHVLRVAASMRS